MSEVPRQLYSTYQARSVIREALGDEYSLRDILEKPEEAKQKAMERINDAVSKEKDVDPARWERDQSYIIKAFDSMVQDLRKTQEKMQAKRRSEFQQKLFSATEEKQIGEILDRMTKNMPFGNAPSNKPLPWKQIMAARMGDQSTYKKRMLDIILSDPLFQGISAADAKTLADLVSKAWAKKQNDIIQKEVEAINRRNDWSRKAKKALTEFRPKILDLIASGALDDQALYNVIAKEYGFRMLNDKEKARLKKIQDEFLDENTPRWKQMELYGELQKIMSELKMPSRLQMLSALWYASVLSSLRTLLDVGGSVANGLFAALD